MKKISSLVLMFAFALSPLAAAAQEAPGGPGGPGDTEVLVYFPTIQSSNVTSATISHAAEAAACAEDDEIMVSLSGVAAGSSDPYSMELGTTTCSGGTWAFTFDASGFADGSIDADVYVNTVLLDEVVTTKDTVGPEVLTYLGGSSYAATFDDGHVFDAASDLLFIEFQADDAATLLCSVDGAAAASCIDLFNFDETYIDIYGYDFSALEAGPHTFSLTATDSYDNESALDIDFCIDTCEEESEPAALTVQLAIRSGTTLLGPYVIELPSAESEDVLLSPTGTTTTYGVPARSVLALLYSLDATSTDFEITDLAYFPGFNSFLVNCVLIPSVSEEPDCFSWTYAVNGSFPSVGMDVTELSEGDVAYVFFGSAWQVSVDESSVEENEEFTATIEKYDASIGEYVPAAGEIAGAVQFDDFFTPTEFATSTTGENGRATLSLAVSGEYFVGAQVVWYFPNVSITVSEVIGGGSSGGGGGGGGVSHLTFNVPAALAYLSGKQNSDGSYSSALLSDWTAVAFAAADPGAAKTKLRAYLASSTPALSGVQDHIRHAMALMSLGIDPYTGTSVDHIAQILASYDGTQIGDSSLDNDDIFALFPLLSAGYTQSDLMVQNIAAFIVSRQSSNGSWTGGADMTAAAVQALSPLASLPGVSNAITKAEAYLHSQQQNNGGFGSSSATSWTMQAIAALGQNETAWSAGGLYPRDYLASLQQSDGGVEPTSANDLTRVWATAYAIPGAVGKSWHALLNDFAKPSTSVTGGTSVTTGTTNTATSSATTTTAVATTTIAVATTTAPAATSTVIAAIIEDIQNETPAQAFETRVAQIDAPPESDQEETVQAVPETREEALGQIAAAAGAGIDWNMLVLAFLALILFGIVGYVAFVRKYWR